MSSFNDWARIFLLLFLFFHHAAAMDNQSGNHTKVYSVNVTIFTSGVAETVSDRFLSVTLDSGLLKTNWQNLNFRSRKVINLARELSPMYVRIGGTLQDFVYFEEMPAKLNYSHKKSPDLKPFNITRTQIDELFTFASNVNWGVIFGLNMLNRNPVSWEPWDAFKLITYIHQKGYQLAGLEMGNEPDVYNLILAHPPDPKIMGTDFQNLRTLMRLIPFLNNSLLLGPDVTNMCTNNGGYIKFFSRYLDAAHTALDAVTIHQYYLNGKVAKAEQFYDPNVMNILENELLSAHKILRRHAPGKKIWLGETSAAWNSGAKSLSNAFIAGFLWLDKLGMAARYDVQVVLRQDFYGNNYGLIDLNTLDPNPDYWLSILYKKLVGTKVLDAVIMEPKGHVRVYAHCTNRKRTGYPPGSVTVFALNVFTDKNVSLLFPQFDDEMVHVYHLQPVGPQGLKSKLVALNGVPLKLTSTFELPPFIPKHQKPPIVIPRLALGFYVFPMANAPACM